MAVKITSQIFYLNILKRYNMQVLHLEHGKNCRYPPAILAAPIALSLLAEQL